MKITAIPFLIGSTTVSFFTEKWEFTVSAVVVLTILVITKQIKVI